MKITKVREVRTPVYGTLESAGLDFYVPMDFQSTIVRPGNNILVPSGIVASVPQHHALIAMNKSGVCTKQGLIVGACVVDSDYRGEIHLHVINVSRWETVINPDDKLVQFLLLPVHRIEVELVGIEEHSVTERGTNGFGHTG